VFCRVEITSLQWPGDSKISRQLDIADRLSADSGLSLNFETAGFVTLRTAQAVGKKVSRALSL